MGDRRIRTMTSDDADLAADVCLRTTLVAYRAIFPLDAPAPTARQLADDWLARLARGDSGFVADAEDGEAIGVVSAGERDDEPGVGLLARLYVVPDRWSEGVGRLLYDEAMDEFARRGFREASLWVLRPNLRARSWYERLGWRLTDAVKPVYEPAGLYDVEYRSVV